MEYKAQNHSIGQAGQAQIGADYFLDVETARERKYYKMAEGGRQRADSRRQRG